MAASVLLQLRLKTRQDAQISLLLFREFAHVLEFEIAQPLFLFLELLFLFVDLFMQETGLCWWPAARAPEFSLMNSEVNVLVTCWARNAFSAVKEILKESKSRCCAQRW